MVVFVNLEDYGRELETLLAEHPVYLCVSYDTDLMALESLTGFVSKWVEFTKSHENLTIEIRTKCGRGDLDIEPCDRVIFAWTISPDPVIKQYEHGSARLSARLEAAAHYLEAGWPVRLCFDPMIYIPGGHENPMPGKNWKQVYSDMLEEVSTAIDMTKVRDFSVGSFRISEAYLKNMRKVMPVSSAVQYPYILDEGYYHYPKKLTEEMESFLTSKILKICPDAKIFRWEET
jgi:spore photoproduct lyase